MVKRKTKTMHQTETNGTFYSMKNSGLNFWEFPLTNGTAFSGIYAHKYNLTKVYTNFQKFLTGNCHSNLIFLPVFLVEWFALRKSIISRLFGKFPRKFPYHFSPFLSFGNLRLNGKLS